MQHRETGRPATHMQTLYMPIESLPTLAPSPCTQTTDPCLNSDVMLAIRVSVHLNDSCTVAQERLPLLVFHGAVIARPLHHLCAHLWSINLITGEYVWRRMYGVHGYEDFDKCSVTRQEKDVFVEV